MEQQLDVCDKDQTGILLHLQQELPALMKVLLNIIKLEHNSKFLPADVGDIVYQLLDIREEMFRTATIQDPNCYVRWPESNTPDEGLEEHSTQFYPNWELTSYLKKYVVSNVRDPDFCNKAYETAETFSFGFLSVGCCCQLNQTLGFELLLNKESPKNLFRLLMCRDLEFSRLRGIIFDHACRLNQYIMNREPQRFQYLRTLVDGVHFRGHKKTKKGTSKKGGHSGCSNGFNSMEYKKYWKSGYYTQGREQIHSQIDALTPSFRQMSYQSYMVMLRTFFALNNLKKRE